MIDRKTPPPIKEIDKIDLSYPEKILFNNNIPVYSINAGTQDIVMIKFIFKAGILYQPESLVAYFTNKMLAEGTVKYTSEQIAQQIEFYGAEIDTETQKDNAYITLYTLNKHLDKLLPVLEDMIKNPVFHEKELLTLTQNQKQNLVVKRKKVSFISREKFNELIFGDNHPYGKTVNLEEFDHLQTGSLAEFHKKRYSSSNCTIIIAGKIEHGNIDLLNKYFGQNDWGTKIISTTGIQHISTSVEKTHLIAKEDVVQSAIRIGKILFNRAHPDYFSFQVLNTVLGGYFGSRLMSNIREDKGYTYGIGSGLASYQNTGVFYISSEVGVNDCRKALDEIYFEIKRLKKEFIPGEELDLVKNYMMGNLLRSMDGPFAITERFCALIELGLSNDFFTDYIKTIRNISSKELMDLANKYFNKDSMIELVVGKIN